MKRYLTLLFVLVTSLSFAAYPVGSRENIDGSVLGWDESNRCWRPIAVDATGQMKGTSTGDVVIASISVDTSKIEGYLNSTSAIHTNIDSMATDTNDILNTLQGNVATDTVINRLGSIEDEVKDIRGVFGDGETATDTIRGRLKSIDEKINGSSGASSWTSTQIENLLGAIGIDDLTRYSSIVANLGEIYSQLTRTVDEAGIIDHFSVSEDLGAIRNLIKKNSEFPDDESTTDVDESDTDSITKLLYDIKSNTAGGSETSDTVTMAIWKLNLSSVSTTSPAIVEVSDTLFKNNAEDGAALIGDLEHREFIELRSSDPEAEFEIGFGGVSSTALRPVKGRIMLKSKNDVTVKVTTPMILYITEGWK